MVARQMTTTTQTKTRTAYKYSRNATRLFKGDTKGYAVGLLKTLVGVTGWW